MPVYTETKTYHTKAHMGMIDVTDDFRAAVQNACRKTGMKSGTITGFTTGGVAGLTTLEFEPGMVYHDLKAAMDVVVHIEIAEKEGRTVPGVSGDDFRPFFRVLREVNYQGAISIEGKGTNEQMAPAFATIAKQAAEAGSPRGQLRLGDYYLQGEFITHDPVAAVDEGPGQAGAFKAGSRRSPG